MTPEEAAKAVVRSRLIDLVIVFGFAVCLLIGYLAEKHAVRGRSPGA